MKADKLEKEFRDKLNGRKINPSAEAWDRLSAMLTVAEEKKPKRDYGWIYIAASIIGFVLIGTFFLSGTEDLIDVRRGNAVIENKEIVEPVIQEKEAMPFKIDSKAVAAGDKARVKNNISVVKPINYSKINNAENEVKQKAITEQLIINQKTEQLVINQEVEKQRRQSEEDAETKKMLENAVVKSEKPKETIRVNARSLLAQVEGDTELSFREKVINKLDKKYQTIKVAIATRNQEQIINQN